jgi:hypothetical protein
MTAATATSTTYVRRPAVRVPYSTIAKPERSNANFVRVGQVLIVPLYDGDISEGKSGLPRGLRLLGKVTIPKHALLSDLKMPSAFGGYDAASNVGEAFMVTQPGRGSINVLLGLPQLKESCVSCRTVHFYFSGYIH